MVKLTMCMAFIVFSLATSTAVPAYDDEIIIAMPTSSSSPKPADEWFQGLDQSKETRTKIHFYLHDVVFGESATVCRAAECGISSTSATVFGAITMVDDVLTVGPEPDSDVVGRAQGPVGSADMREFAIQMGLNIIFTAGKYNGSTISILGRNPLFHKLREMPVVGGTGVFRMAKGIAVSSTYSRDVKTFNEVLEYTLYVTHY